MTSFKRNKIFLESETVAQQLRNKRQTLGITLPQAAQKLGINYKYLTALEKGDFENLPAGVYGKNFLREYSIFLGLNYQELSIIYDKEIAIINPSNHNNLFSYQIAKAWHFLAVPKIIRTLIILFIAAACFVYLGYAVEKIVSPPALTISSPIENLITDKKIIEVSGTAEGETEIEINGEMVLSDTSGYFAKMVNLKQGVNIITITAKKKYGRENTVVRQILVK